MLLKLGMHAFVYPCVANCPKPFDGIGRVKKEELRRLTEQGRGKGGERDMETYLTAG